MKQAATEILVMQQDYAWFLAALTLGLALAVGWNRSAHARQPWWNWVLAGNLVMVLVELAWLTQTYRPQIAGSTSLAMDLSAGTVLALQAWAVWCPRRRWWQIASLLPFLALAWLRQDWPWSATLALGLILSGGIIRQARGAAGHAEWAMVLAGLLALWFSPVGPATGLLNNLVTQSWAGAIVGNAPQGGQITPLTVGLRRWSDTGLWGVWTALAQLGFGAVCLWGLTRQLPSARARREWRWFASLAVVWLLTGFLLAMGLGWKTRRDHEEAQKSRAELAAKLIPVEELAAAFGPLYEPRLLAGSDNVTRLKAEVSPEFQAAVMPVRRRLATIQSTLPEGAYALILVERGGWLAIAAFTADLPMRPDLITVLGPARPGPVPPRTEFLRPYQEVYGLVTQARAPLHFPDGRLLGWLALEFGPEAWLAGQAQARVQALVMVGLGLGIALMGLRQRLKNLARDEALQAAELARQADRTKSEFLARVSHELRTPIQSVLGYGELLQSAVQGEAARARLAALRQHGLLMLRLVNDLLDLGALQTGRFHLVPRPTRTAELVRQTLESLRPRAEAKGLAFDVVLVGEATEWRMADGERLRQVVLNLAANAIKFTDRGSVQVTYVAQDDDTVLLKVSDTGPGIAPGSESRLFQPFSRLENTAAKEGTGLGLVLAKALCESMGGGLALEPQARGACFVARFRLPPTPPPPATGGAPVLTLQGRTILVVDDNTLIRELFSTYLRELGADCSLAADGPSALQQAATRTYDTVVLDLALPGMTGTEVARALRLRILPEARIIGVSAHASAEDRAQALAAGMDAFLSKPVDLRDLAEEIEKTHPPQAAGAPGLTGLHERLRAQFRTEAPGLEAALATAVNEGDWAAVRSRAHYLKNSADVLGLQPLSVACQALELAAAAEQVPEARAAARDCRTHLQPWC